MATGSPAEGTKIELTSLFRYIFFLVAYAAQSVRAVLFDVPMCVRKRSQRDLQKRVVLCHAVHAAEARKASHPWHHCVWAGTTQSQVSGC